MGAIRKINIAVGDDVGAEIDAAVASGEFATVDDVVAAALNAWTLDRGVTHSENVLRLKRFWADGIVSGEAAEVTDSWFEGIKRRGQARIDAADTAR